MVIGYGVPGKAAGVGYAPVPMAVSPAYGAAVKVVAVTHDPDGHWFAQRAVAPDGRDLHFFRFANFGELVGGPLRHRRVSFAPILRNCQTRPRGRTAT